jgi:hypothetical protein
VNDANTESIVIVFDMLCISFNDDFQVNALELETGEGPEAFPSSRPGLYPKGSLHVS